MPGYPVAADSLGMAHVQGSGIDDGNPRTLPHGTEFKEEYKGMRHSLLTLRETVIGKLPGKRIPEMLPYMMEVEVLQVSGV